MATGRISKRTVDACEPGDKDQFLWDSELAGFGLKVTPAGRKVFIAQYRHKGRTKRITLGQYGKLTPDQARIEAKRVLGEAATGQDPAEGRTKGGTSQTVGALLDRFLVEHVDAKLKANSIDSYRRIVKLHIPATLKRRGINDITRADI